MLFVIYQKFVIHYGVSLFVFVILFQYVIFCYSYSGIRTRVLKTRALKDISPKNTIPNGHES